MSDPRYVNIGTPFVRLAEECAEVIQCCMKIERFGLYNINPRTGQANVEAMKLELQDLKDRIEQVESMLS